MAKLDPGARSGFGSSPSGGGTQNEDWRRSLQQRLALFGAVVVALNVGFFLFANVMTTLLVRDYRLLHWFYPDSQRWHLVSAAAAGLVWLLCRSQWHWSRRTLDAIDALGLLGQISAYAMIGIASSEAGRGIELPLPTMELGPLNAALPALLATILVTVSRAVVVPSRALRTFVVSTIGAIPTGFALTRIMAVSPAEATEGHTATIVILWIWCGTGIALATVTSRIIYGLRQEVSVARQLGQYTLLEKLGEGGMGEVYRARHAMLRRPTAIKLLPAERSGEDNLRRFEREVQLLSQLTHPNTVAVYDYGRTAEGLFYYAMEYLDGVTLEDLVLHDGPQPPGRVIHMLAQAAAALDEAHGADLIHRDVKPANVILCERGGVPDVVKVLDFGLVKVIGGGHDLGTSSVDTIHGTPLYLSPEAIISPERVGPGTDLYSLGAVGYRLLTGRHVFAGRSLVEICGHHLHTAPTPISTFVPSVPEDLERQILQCLAKDPAARPAGAAALRRSLLACVDAPSWTEDDARAWWRERGPAVRKCSSYGSPCGKTDSAVGLRSIVPTPKETPDPRGSTSTAVTTSLRLSGVRE